jgi:hypothetical protein
MKMQVAAGALDPVSVCMIFVIIFNISIQDYAPNYTNTAPSVLLGPHPSWFGTEKVMFCTLLNGLTCVTFFNPSKAASYLFVYFHFS